ncbi:hypothetical protein [Streptomyces sp. NPDC048659]|uniref:hypothetical protein n=1 Tax=Streptomyces sp. NPDC048659 TaxID=3155489 RepID=UPI00342A4614
MDPEPGARGRGETVVLRWAQGPRSVPMARRSPLDALESWGLDRVAESASLVRIEVHDASEVRPLMALPGDGAEGGWGLPLVEVLSEKWGVSDRCGPGKLVWAELRTDRGPEGASRVEAAARPDA